MKNNYFRLIIFLFIAGFFTSCSSSSAEQSTKDALLAFLNDNELIVGFGNADLKAILMKSDYQNIPKIGKLLDSEMTNLEKLINFDVPIYYALEGPFDDEGTPLVTYTFFDVKNTESLIAELTQRGFDVNTLKGMFYCSDGNVSIGVKESLAILIHRKGEYDTAKILEKTFKKTERKLSEDKVEETLSDDGDIVLVINIASLYSTSDTGLSILSKDKQSELKDLVENSYIQTVIKFEDGLGVLEMNNFLSQELGDRMFFKSDNKAPVVAKLGIGRPLFGLSMNLDLKKVQGLVNEFSPDAMIELGRAMGGPAQFALMAVGDEGIAGLFNGQFGIVTVGEQKMMGGAIPDFNLFIGLEKKGKYIGNLAKDFMSYGSTEITLNDDGLSASTNPIYASSASVSLKLPKGCEGFGKSGVSAFLNLEGLEGISKILNAVKYITFEYNENGGVLYIKAKKAQESILKQTAQGLIEEFSSEINRISL